MKAIEPASFVRSVIPVNLSMKRDVLRSLFWVKSIKLRIKYVVQNPDAI